MKFIAALLAILAIAGAGGYYYYSHSDAKTQEKLKAEATDIAQQADRDAIKLKIKATQDSIAMYDKFLAACQAHREGRDAKLEGYDAFDYNKESDYKGAKDEQEARLKDLQERLNQAYDKK